jgi:hypothetical protein
MIPAPPEIPAPSSQGPKSRSPAVSCPAVPCAAVPCPAVPCPPGLGVTPAVPPQTRPKANDPGTPTLPPRHKRFRPTTPPRSRSASPHPPPVPSPRRLRFPALAGPAWRRAFPPSPFHPHLAPCVFARPCLRLSARPLTPLCPSYARRLSRIVDYTCASGSAPCLPRPPHPTTRWGICRSNNSMNVALYLIDSVERHIHGKSARGVAWRLWLAVDVRMAQRVVPVRGSRLVPVGGADWSSRGVARHRVEHAAEWGGR